MVLSEFDQNCTLLVHRSHHHYVQPGQSVAATLVAAAAGTPGPQTGDVAPHFPQQPNINDLQKRLENGKTGVKLQALKEVLLWVMQPATSDVASAAGSGGSVGAHVASKLLMTIIRFVLPSGDHQTTKMLQLYWEMVEKTKGDGSLKEEMILVCNKLREDLLHPNEFIRGSTLRLLCKIKFVKILEPLVEAIIQNLSHHHAYVRRNAIMCVYSMVRSFGSDILPHAAEEIERLLLVESDLSTKRNAFLMLIHCDVERAVNYALSVQDNIGCLGDIFQLALLELLRKVSRESPAQIGNLLRIIVALVDSCSPAVAYEGGSALIALSQSPVALKAATRAYVGLLTRQPDNTVKLIVLDRLNDILEKHQASLEEFVIDVLRALSSPSFAVRKKALTIALRLVSARTVEDVMNTLKRELINSLGQDLNQDSDSAQHTNFQQLLIRSMRAACKGRVDAIIPTIPLLLDFLTNRNAGTATEVALFMRELVSSHCEVRELLIPKLIDAVPEIPNCRVARICLWIIGEYSEDQEIRQTALNALFDALLPMPFPDEIVEKSNPDAAASEEVEKPAATVPEPKIKVTTRTVVLPDGTYGTEDVFEADEEGNKHAAEIKQSTKLRGLVVGGDFLLCSLLAVTCTKILVSDLEDVSGVKDLDPQSRAKCLLIVCSLLKLCRGPSNGGATTDAAIRINQAYRIVTSIGNNKAKKVSQWFPESRTALKALLSVEKEAALYEADGFGEFKAAGSNEETEVAEPDEQVMFRQLGEMRTPATAVASLDDSETDLNLALGLTGQKEDLSLFQQRLARVQQMTGLADPVYVEAFLQVHQFDLIVELLIINRTTETLQNVNVELSTHGDMKIVERPVAVTLAAGQSHTVYSSIKVQSTETGIIFGHITFDKSSAVDKEYLVLNELHVDLLDFIQRSWVGEMTFRAMWAEFEWENKITINTTTANVETFLERVMQQTNMTVVGKYMSSGQDEQNRRNNLRNRDTPWNSSSDSRLENDYINRVKKLPGLRRLMDNSAFFAVNLYSRSIFGEDALANVSIEKLPGGKLAGNVRIRSRSQGIALSLGDRITVVQRGLLV